HRGGSVFRVDHADRHAPRRHRLGPDDAGVVVTLLDGGGDDAADPDAVAAHGHQLGLAALVDHRGVERLGVFPAELEHVAHLDPPRHVEHAVAVGRGVALEHVAQVGNAVDACVALPVGAGVVAAVGVAAADEVGQHRGVAIDDHRDGRGQADRADEAGAGAAGGANFLFAGEYRLARQFGQLAGLDLVDLVVAA